MILAWTLGSGPGIARGVVRQRGEVRAAVRAREARLHGRVDAKRWALPAPENTPFLTVERPPRRYKPPYSR
jgi:hypothetical protein